MENVKELINGICDDLESALSKIERFKNDVNLSQISDKETTVLIMLGTDIRTANVRAKALRRLNNERI